mgnify:CR=1 FL=1
MMSGKVLIFSAPSGSGKSTVVHHILGLHPEIEFSVSATSRAPRGSEQDGVEYLFYSAEVFRALVADDKFVEYEEVYPDCFYGTLKSEVNRIWAKGHVIIFDVDVKGGVSLKKYFGEKALSVFIVDQMSKILNILDGAALCDNTVMNIIMSPVSFECLGMDLAFHPFKVFGMDHAAKTVPRVGAELIHCHALI